MTPRTVAPQAPLSMGLSRQEYWSGGLPFPPSGDLPDPEIKLASPAASALAGRFFTTWEALLWSEYHTKCCGGCKDEGHNVSDTFIATRDIH